MSGRFFGGGKVAANQVLPFLEEACAQAQGIELAISFVRFSGVRLILDALKQADQRHVPIRLICGSYLGITEPAALECLVRELSDRVQIRFFTDPVQSFHPKCWIFHMEEEEQILIGSSNISRSALTWGVEWNYLFSSRQDGTSVENICRQFDQLWKHSAILDEKMVQAYRQSWQKPQVAALDLEDSLSVAEADDPCANAVQQQALYALEDSRKSGQYKALVQAATGTGKTYLAAFDSRKYDRILFVAHRQEILEQAARTFQRVDPARRISFVMDGIQDIRGDAVFASVMTLGKKSFLRQSCLKPDSFDYIVIDEFHHAAAGLYKNILEYFRPKFMLGLTATPYRMDGKDIYALCDYNVPYRIDLFEAIRQGFLVPFRYFGIYDPTSYGQVRIRGLKFNESDLDVLFLENEKRAELIRRNYQKHMSRQALGFCVSRAHARYMAGYFSAHGIPSVSVVSAPDIKNHSTDRNRTEALKELASGQIKAIFSVDMFNEGVDIPSVDMVMFLRPTESAVVYLQQLGRGLRKAAGKAYLTVLDFIGNYKSASLGPSLIMDSGQLSLRDSWQKIPDGCFVDFDLQLIDIFEQLQKFRENRPARIRRLWREVKDQLGHVPGRMEFFQELSVEDIDFLYKNSKDNPFNNYLDFLASMQSLTEEQKAMHNGPAGRFIHYLEQTSMSKVYKLPLLASFITDHELKRSVRDEDVLPVWKSFFSTGRRWIDLAPTYAQFSEIPDKAHLRNIRSNPAHFLASSGREFFSVEPGSILKLNDILIPYLKDETFVREVQDVLDQRCERYFSHRYEQDHK